ncbi:MAG TPA: zinc-binding dehydrogenase [Candidatus Acidoferrum sp.]|nr:zinc-binding dehydrogenase [Candidatus Acidoferrum sp.]
MADVPKPSPGPAQVLIEVKAAGVNYAEIEQTRGKYPVFKPFPFVMGFEAAGIVAEVGSAVKNLKIGDRVAAIVSSGGYAEYAVADASTAILIQNELSFAQATSITIQGLSAYALLKLAAKPLPTDTVLIQAAAGGVGLFLVQLSKILGVKRVIALASTEAKLALAKNLGADVAINYSRSDWGDQVMQATGGLGADLVLECVSGALGEQSFKLLAPFGRVVVFGAKNMYDTITPEKLQQLIHKNQSLIGFNFPSLRPEQVAPCISDLLGLISRGQVKLFAENAFPLAHFERAFEALAGRGTIGKVVLIP